MAPIKALPKIPEPQGDAEIQKAKRGRPEGSKSRHKNPANIAADHAGVMMEVWLGTRPERRFTVPPKVKRQLCERAIEHLTKIGALHEPKNLENFLGRVLAVVNRRAPDISLRRKR